MVLQMVVGNVHGGGDGRRGGRRSEQGADELPAFAVSAVDGRGQLHVHGQEHGRVEEPPSSGGRHARHERARGAGPGRGRVRPVRVVHMHHVHRRRHREYRRVKRTRKPDALTSPRPPPTNAENRPPSGNGCHVISTYIRNSVRLYYVVCALALVESADRVNTVVILQVMAAEISHTDKRGSELRGPTDEYES